MIKNKHTHMDYLQPRYVSHRSQVMAQSLDIVYRLIGLYHIQRDAHHLIADNFMSEILYTVR